MAVIRKFRILSCLAAAILFSATTGSAQTFSPELRFGIDAGKTILEAAIFRNTSLEAYTQWRPLPNAGLHLGGGYGWSGTMERVYHNVYNYRAQGIFLKPGALFFPGDGDAQVGLLLGMSWVKEKGTYRISGPYWGDLEGPADMRKQEVFLELMFSERFRIKDNWYVQLGIAQDFFFHRSSSHVPEYIPGSGNSRSRNFPSIMCALQYNMKVRKPN